MASGSTGGTERTRGRGTRRGPREGSVRGHGDTLTGGHRGEDGAADRRQVGGVRGRRTHLVEGVGVVDVICTELLDHLGQEEGTDPEEKRVSGVQEVGARVAAVEVGPGAQPGDVGSWMQPERQETLQRHRAGHRATPPRENQGSGLNGVY